MMNLNTSHVNLNLEEDERNAFKDGKFKYISC